MSNALVSHINRADAGTITAGSWQVSLPLTNLQNTRLSKVARSTNALAASTKFDIDLGTGSTVVRMVGFIRHNFSQDATFRLTAGDAPGVPLYDTGFINLWQPVYGLFDREFEDPDWFSGRISAAEAAAYGMTHLLDMEQNIVYRYWRVEFLDTGNAAGYVQLGRFWLGPAWQPKITFDWGSSLAFESRDRAMEMRSGARIFEKMKPRRVWQVSFAELSEQEAFGRALEINRATGTESEIAIMPDPADVANYHRRNLFGRVRSWGQGIVDAALNKQVMTATVEERL